MAVGYHGWTEDRAAPGLTVRLEVGEQAAHVVVAGELDLATAPLLARVLRTAVQSGRAAVEVDLGAVSFADCCGARPLVEASRSATEAGGRVTVTRSNAIVSTVLAHLGLPSTARTGQTGVIPPAVGLPAPRRGE